MSFLPVSDRGERINGVSFRRADAKIILIEVQKSQSRKVTSMVISSVDTRPNYNHGQKEKKIKPSFEGAQAFGCPRRQIGPDTYL